MALTKESREKLESLLGMSFEQFFWLGERWKELALPDRYKIGSSREFSAGYVFGKIEHKFAEWFFATYACALSDDEYREFYGLVAGFVDSKMQS